MTTTTHHSESPRHAITRRLARPAALGLGVLAATALFTGTASAAVPGLVVVGSLGGNNSLTPKGVASLCPPGKKVIGGGARVVLPGSNVALAKLVPNVGFNAFFAVAHEDQDGTPFDWALNTIAVCANPLPGLHVVTETSAFDSFVRKNVIARCPSGENVVGLGGEIEGGGGEVALEEVITAGPTRAIAGARERQDGTVEPWSVRAYAVCANPLPGYETVRKLSASDSSTTKSLTVGCPSGKVVLGAGAQLSSSAPMPVVLSDLAKAGSQARAIATEDQVGHAADWKLAAEAICASA